MSRFNTTELPESSCSEARTTTSGSGTAESQNDIPWCVRDCENDTNGASEGKSAQYAVVKNGQIVRRKGDIRPRRFVSGETVSKGDASIID